MDILEKILKLNQQTLHIKKGSKILVGLSGGADSTALICALLELKSILDISVIALHVNHGIRGKEADRDEDFARNLCRSKNVEFFCVKTDIPSLCKQSGNSTELEARLQRYAAFEKLADEQKADYIATAHNKNDLCETMLFNLVRGSMLKGLCSVPPKRGNIIRPLLYCSRDEIEKYLEKINQEYVTDSTNSDTVYSRNLLRHKVLPILHKLNPSLCDTLSRTAAGLRRDSDFLFDLANNNLNDNTEILCELHPSVCSRVIYLLHREKFGTDICEISNAHIEKIMELIYAHGKEEGYRAKVCLHGKNFAVIKKRKLIFCRESENTCCTAQNFNITLKKGENLIPNTGFMIFVGEKQEKVQVNQIIYNLLNKIELHNDIIKGNLFVRNRAFGDSYKTLGMTKSLKKLLNEKKIPPEQREGLPILCDNDGIIYVPYCTVADRFSFHNTNNTNNEKTCIYFYETKNELE